MVSRVGACLAHPHSRFSLVPGPTPLQPATVAVCVRAPGPPPLCGDKPSHPTRSYGQPWDRSPDLEEGFFTQYAGCQSMLLVRPMRRARLRGRSCAHAFQDLLRAPHDASAVIASGEAMVVRGRARG